MNHQPINQNETTSRIGREERTVAVMVALYCHKKHAGKELCPDCRKLLVYASERLKKCPYQEGKTTCSKCPIHCYRPEMRDKIRTVMRYSGPRMLYRHPVLAVWHLIDKRRQKPVITK